MERLALLVMARLGIESRLGAEVRVTKWSDLPKGHINKEIAYRMANHIVDKVNSSETQEMTVINNVPEYMGINVHRAEAIVFSPSEFDEFLKEYSKAVILNKGSFE